MATALHSWKEIVDVSDLDDASDRPKVAIVVSDWNTTITHGLLSAAIEQLQHVGIAESDIPTLHVPGSFELPYGVKRALSLYSDVDAVIAIGCVIKGDTRHDEYINKAVTSALMQLSLVGNTPIIMGLLTTENEQQAKDRAGGSHGNKGYEWAVSALKMAALKTKDVKRKIGF